jgi:hypothetical protein
VRRIKGANVKSLSWTIGVIFMACNAEPMSGPTNDASTAIPRADRVVPDSGSEPLLEAGVEDVTAVDAGTIPVAQIPCDELHQAWRRFVGESRSCELDSECAIFEVFIGGPDMTTCDRPYGLEAVIRGDRMAKAEQYAARYFSAECSALTWTDFGDDSGPKQNPQCREGRCSAEETWCREAEAGP